MLENAIRFLHWICIFLMSTYAFIFKKNRFDYFYISIFYLMFLNWTFLNGECIITYASKYIVDPHYVPGKNVHDDDFKKLFGNNVTTHLIAKIIKDGLLYISFCLVCIRNHISEFIYIPFIFLFAVYSLVIANTEHPYKNKNFLLYQEIMKYILIVGGILLFRKWKF